MSKGNEKLKELYYEALLPKEAKTNPLDAKHSQELSFDFSKLRMDTNSSTQYCANSAIIGPSEPIKLSASQFKSYKNSVLGSKNLSKDFGKANESLDYSTNRSNSTSNQTYITTTKKNHKSESFNLNIIHSLNGLLGERPNVCNRFEKLGEEQQVLKLKHSSALGKDEKDNKDSHKIIKEVNSFCRVLTNDPKKLHFNRPVPDLNTKKLDLSVKGYFESFGETTMPVRAKEVSKIQQLKKLEISAKKILEEDIFGKDSRGGKDSFEKFVTEISAGDLEKKKKKTIIKEGSKEIKNSKLVSLMEKLRTSKDK